MDAEHGVARHAWSSGAAVERRAPIGAAGSASLAARSVQTYLLRFVHIGPDHVMHLRRLITIPIAFCAAALAAAYATRNPERRDLDATARQGVAGKFVTL